VDKNITQFSLVRQAARVGAQAALMPTAGSLLHGLAARWS
jgi:hypothetical protein